MSAPIDPRKLDLFAEVLRLYGGSDAGAQRLRVREVLQRGHSLTTFEASRYLDVYYCPARIHEIRSEGLEVETHWANVLTEAGEVHRVGMYLLSREVSHAS